LAPKRFIVGSKGLAARKKGLRVSLRDHPRPAARPKMPGIGLQMLGIGLQKPGMKRF
jgi:hypothetical protein